MPTKLEFVRYCNAAAAHAEGRGDGNTAAQFQRIVTIAATIDPHNFEPGESRRVYSSGRLAEAALKNGDLPTPAPSAHVHPIDAPADAETTRIAETFAPETAPQT